MEEKEEAQKVKTADLILMHIEPKDCPIIPTGPGSWWLGYLHGAENREDFNSVLGNLKKDQRAVELQNTWVYFTQTEVVSMQDPQDPKKARVGSRRMTMILPVFDAAPPSGVTINVAVTHWIWPTKALEIDLRSQMEQVGLQMVEDRSSLTVVQPSQLPKPLHFTKR